MKETMFVRRRGIFLHKAEISLPGQSSAASLGSPFLKFGHLKADITFILDVCIRCLKNVNTSKPAHNVNNFIIFQLIGYRKFLIDGFRVLSVSQCSF